MSAIRVDFLGCVVGFLVVVQGPIMANFHFWHVVCLMIEFALNRVPVGAYERLFGSSPKQ